MTKILVGFLMITMAIGLVVNFDHTVVVHAQKVDKIERRVKRTAKKVVKNRQNQHTAMRVFKAIGHSLWQLLVKIGPWLLKIAEAILMALVKLFEQIYHIVTTQHHVATH